MKRLFIFVAMTAWSPVFAAGISVTLTHSALAGYCVQSLRWQLNQGQQSLLCEHGLTAQQCNQIKQPIRASLATTTRIFDLWRIYGLNLDSNDAPEFLRGVAEAKADIAYAKDLVDEYPLPPSASDEDVAKMQSGLKAAEASDLRIQAIQKRAAICLQGPPL